MIKESNLRMFSSNLKVCAFPLLLLMCAMFVNGLRTKDRYVKNDESSLESGKEETELLSTIESIIKDLDEKVEKDVKELEKEEKEELIDAVTEENELEKEIEKEEESEKEEVKEELEKQEEEIATEEKEEEKNEEPVLTTEEERENDIQSSEPSVVTESSGEKEKGPDDAFVVWNTKGKICILARFHIGFSITYSSKGGEQKAEASDLKNGVVKGKCDTSSKSRLLQISWGKYVFTMLFNRTEEDTWLVTSMELTYDTSDSLFDGATNPGKKTARSKPLHLFETSMKNSFYCPAEEVVLMYSGNKHVVTTRMKEIHLQPYEIEDGEFSSVERCSKVVIDGPDQTPYIQDETVPLAVGCTLALITLLILLGFSFHRAYNAAKVDYNTME